MPIVQGVVSGRRRAGSSAAATGLASAVLLYCQGVSGSRPSDMDFHILGPLEARDQGRVVKLGGAKQRALLAVLLLHQGETLSAPIS